MSATPIQMAPTTKALPNIPNVFFRVLGATQKPDGLHVPKVDLVPEHEHVQELAYVFLPVIAVHVFALSELGADLGEFLLHPVALALAARGGLADVGDKG